MTRQERVAIVGIGGRFPGSADLDEYWSNIRDARDLSSDPPEGRWAIPPERVLDVSGVKPDRVPTLRGYYLKAFEPDFTGLDLRPFTTDDLDPVFHLALHIGNTAWRSAKTENVDRRRCGVVLGNIALPIEKANLRTLETLGPKLGLWHPATQTNSVNKFSTGLPAALIARGLGFRLGGYALDAACASSLYALKLACDELLAGRADAMIAGGLVRPDSLYTQMGFAQLRALSPSGRCAPFDERADGLIVGEGGCAFVLKRLSDALKAGDTIHATIAGIGLSNDIEGNVLQPASEGQLRALHAAYAQAGWKPSDVQLIECHATGTPTGDAVEFDSLRQLWRNETGRAVIGGVKSTVGHLLTGAGAASLAKILLAMKNRTLPPTANFETPSSKLNYQAGPFRILKRAEPWESNGPRRAAINGFGFGGINAHVLIEEWTEETSSVSVSVPDWIEPEPIAVVGLASRSGSPIDSLAVPVAKFRIPPKELEEMLPQQLLMLQVADEAMTGVTGERKGVFVGVSLDPNTTNYHLRWLAGEIDETLKDQVHPALTANRTMGSLASISASRVARYLKAGGPSFAVCDEEAGGVRAIALAVEALRNGEIDLALAGAVEFACDPRYGGSQDGAGAVALKRLADAERAGDRVFAVIKNVQAIEVCSEHSPPAGAASGILDFVEHCRGLDEERSYSNGLPAYWIHNRSEGPRLTSMFGENIGGFGLEVDLEEAPTRRTSPLVRIEQTLHTFAANSVNELTNLVAEATRFGEFATDGKFRLAFVADDEGDFENKIRRGREHLRSQPLEPLADSIFYAPNPLGGEIAFVYPGSGNHFADMGRELGLAFPQILNRQMAENQNLRGQYHADEVWGIVTLDGLSPRELIFAQVALGTLISDLLAAFGVKPQAVVPYSLGESAGLYGTRAWQDRDEMFRRMNVSSLFASDLAGSCDSARTKWKLPAGTKIDWLTGVVNASPERVLRVIEGKPHVYLQIVNTSDDCVIGGERSAVEAVVRELGASFFEVRGVSTAHCEVAEPVRDAYRELHLLPTIPAEGVRYYSGAFGRAYTLNRESAADAITAAALDTIDFPAVVRAAYDDGARIFVEVGPGTSCSRMIDRILEGKPHLAHSACVASKDEVGTFLNLLANLFVEGVDLDLAMLQQSKPKAEAIGPVLVLPVGYHPERVAVVEQGSSLATKVAFRSAQVRSDLPEHDGERLSGADVSSLSRSERRLSDSTGNLAANPAVILAEVQTATMQAHDAFLRFSTALQNQFAAAVAGQTIALQSGHLPPARDPNEIPRSLEFAECMEFARGLVGNVLGPKFAAVDSFPTRVRLPDGPLQLVDRIALIEGEPLSMTNGRIVTEHTVRADRWYLDQGRAPGCISIEAGQADLFLSGFLGIDFITKGLACYRLLDASVTFHRELPKVGEHIVYDIRIDHFFRQGDTYLFRFNFEGKVNGDPLLTMRDGIAGFFTAQELDAGKGVIHTALDLKPMPGKTPADWQTYVPLREEAMDEVKVDALRRGDFAEAFGAEFLRANLRNPLRLPGGMLSLVHRVERIDPTGGRYGLGRIRCQADIHPDDWFLTCHFVDDQVMPGTLMYECCLHTLRVLLMRMGFVCEDGEATFEPVPGVPSKLKCRGQVIASTKVVTYEVSIKEIGFRPEPFVIGDALMYADGKPIVDIQNISLRLNGLTRERLDEIWSEKPCIVAEASRFGNSEPKRDASATVFSKEQVLEFATGMPSKAFGDRYLPFDRDRFIARLPADPYSFIDRVSNVENCEPWKLAPGAIADVEYNVPRDAWFFASNRCEYMPYCVLNEIALQACGWMAAYLGSALTSPNAMHFRNLGGNAIQHAAVTPASGLLNTRIKLTKVSPAAGMIILQFDFETRNAAGSVYSGDTTFGFFTKESLANQVGVKEASFVDHPAARPMPVPIEPPFPDSMLRMVDAVIWNDTISGPKKRGLIEGKASVKPDAWFFKAHFFHDPVWPGSLGLESVVQLLKVHAHTRWSEPSTGWQAMAPGERHRWIYRGQILPTASEVTVQAYITQVDDARRLLKADGLVGVDGRIIYQVADFTLQG